MEPTERVKDLVANQHCEGACVAHVGTVSAYLVRGWGWWSYCDTAVARDRWNNFTVTPEDQVSEDDD